MYLLSGTLRLLILFPCARRASQAILVIIAPYLSPALPQRSLNVLSSTAYLIILLITVFCILPNMALLSSVLHAQIIWKVLTIGHWMKQHIFTVYVDFIILVKPLTLFRIINCLQDCTHMAYVAVAIIVKIIMLLLCILWTYASDKSWSYFVWCCASIKWRGTGQWHWAVHVPNLY